ncbi:hypothetical protein SOCEGT47_041150 [Sorangium cellulosum]|uniref:Uncharacterized protein n=1 Tax=Sorangium cellulosum TaxID=56 RepID=A0A4P2Q3L6_SORCE|nr:hypothetical protein [Sorangium cellulosum]AUX23588.1 hypothetical protein SOCEGT47_041150 [Sorangium cellulosum]
MSSSRKPPGPLPPWVDPIWGSDTPETRQEQLRRLARAQARGSVLFREVRGMRAPWAEDPRLQAVRVEMAGWAAKLAAAEQEQEESEAWVSAVPVKREGNQRTSRLALLGTVIFVLGILCGVVLAILRLR